MENRTGRDPRRGRQNQKERRAFAIALMLVFLFVYLTVPVYAQPSPSPLRAARAGIQGPQDAYLEDGWYKPEVDWSYQGRNATKIPVFTYHRIASDKERTKYFAGNSLFLSESLFKKQMALLHKNGYRTLSLEEFYLWHRGELKLPERSCVITFDDGSYSVLKYALPVLKKYNMKATMFMIGNQIKKKTVKTRNAQGKYGFCGMDILQEVNRTYPNFQFESHTYAVHKKTAAGTPIGLKKSQTFLNKDARTQYDKFRFHFLAYPYGAFNRNMIKAAKANHIKMAFQYGTNGYATKKQDIYQIRRIKVSANGGMEGLSQWLK